MTEQRMGTQKNTDEDGEENTIRLWMGTEENTAGMEMRTGRVEIGT